jgi:hypothetical protein
MALIKNIKGNGGFDYTYSIVRDVRTPNKSLATFDVLSYKDKDASDAGENAGRRSHYEMPITQEQYEAGVTPAQCYAFALADTEQNVDSEGAGLFDGATSDV